MVVKDIKGLEGSGRVIIPRDIVELVAKTKTKSTIKITNSKLSVDDFSFEFNPVEGKYPNYSTVIPPDENKKPGKFGFYQSKHLKVLEELGKAFEVNPIFHRTDERFKPLKAVYHADGETVIACIMPMTVRTPERERWIKEIPMCESL